MRKIVIVLFVFIFSVAHAENVGLYGIGDEVETNVIAVDLSNPKLKTSSTSTLASTQGSGYMTDIVTANKVSDSLCKPTPRSVNDRYEDGMLMYKSEVYHDNIRKPFGSMFDDYKYVSALSRSTNIFKYAVRPTTFPAFIEYRDLAENKYKWQNITHIRYYTHKPTAINWYSKTTDKNGKVTSTSTLSSKMLGCYQVNTYRGSTNYYWLSEHIGYKGKDYLIEVETKYGNLPSMHQTIVYQDLPLYVYHWTNWIYR